jgi:hypothetical protein
MPQHHPQFDLHFGHSGVLATPPATGTPHHSWQHRLVVWALGLAALLMVLLPS